MQEKYQLCVRQFLGAEILSWGGFQSFKGNPRYSSYQASSNGYLGQQGDAGDPRAPSLRTEVERATEDEADSSFQGTQQLWLI